ncbi:MAG: hypothetical protein ACR2NJ_01525 [Acidimicrobiales bacterium]
MAIVVGPGPKITGLVVGSSPDPAGEGFEAGFGDEGVDEAKDEFAVVVCEFAEGGEAVAEGVFDGAEGAAGNVFEDEVVDGGVEDFSDADGDVE